ncbi:MAG TPA: 2-C-methyl-D-erythritol 2,4-cyclodiphosphate synthase [Dehalococcoidia bacterium]|nr:2-C-methyl-D-erythritol 2,4-cyclodiphosphate synthase [Dehalococcoidia bacterium]
MRIGIGYDIHRYGEGRPLVIGGVLIPGERGLSGHSDADVALHAIIDATLGAAGLGDIGQHFPPDDPAYQGADSGKLLTRTLEMVAASGYRMESLDATIIAERPRLSPYLAEMRERIAEIAGLEVFQVNIKATTNEGIGAIGRGEGMAALAVVLLQETEQQKL